MTGPGSTGPGAGDPYHGSTSRPGHPTPNPTQTPIPTPPVTVRLKLRHTVARVLVRGADTATRWVTRLLGESPTAGRAQISEAELRDLVAASTVLDGEKRHLIDEVIAVGRRHVRELMVPRTEVVFLDAATPIPVAAAAVRSLRHSRFPVIDGTHDDVVGFVHLRDLLIRPEDDPRVSVGELARELRQLPASKRLLPALSEMRRAGDHLALVVDEYGGTAGIVTLEDLIEELVGEIHDEYDAAPEPGLLDGVTPSEVDGLLNLNDFAERVGFALPPGPYATVGGFLMARLGKLPGVGDEVAVGERRLRVVALDGRRVDRVAVDPTGLPAVDLVRLPGAGLSTVEPVGLLEVDLVPGLAVGGDGRPARAEQVVRDPSRVGALQAAHEG